MNAKLLLRKVIASLHRNENLATKATVSIKRIT